MQADALCNSVYLTCQMNLRNCYRKYTEFPVYYSKHCKNLRHENLVIQQNVTYNVVPADSSNNNNEIYEK